jgi:hypothetical protein
MTPDHADSRTPAAAAPSRLDRRAFLARLAALPIVTGLGISSKPRAPRPPVTVYKSPTCGCCTKWVEHMQKGGFKVTVKDMADVAPIKKDLGVADALASCHTAVLGPYVLEGHVPADLVDKLLAEKPAGAKGLAVPGMPASSPGMDMPGEKFDVLLMLAGGKTRKYATR